jgi:hypothetical protein
MSSLILDSKWDLSSLQLDSATQLKAATGTATRRRRSSTVGGSFVRGPIPVDWLCRAAHLGGSALVVGLDYGTLRACGNQTPSLSPT